MIRFAILLAALPLAGCATIVALEGAQRPPAQYQGSRPVLVEFVTPELVMTRCAQRGAWLANACADREVITIANPCRFREPYADILCHELGHINGWPADHRR